MSWTIRPARLDDLPAIVDRWQELMAVHQALDPVLYATEVHAAGTYQGFIRRHMTGRDGLVLVAANAAGAVAGYVVGGVGQRSPVFRIQRVGMIFDLAVRPDLRRSGIGKQLCDAANAHFAQAGITHAQVNFAPENTSASAFWPREGFTPLLIEAYKPLQGR